MAIALAEREPVLDPYKYGILSASATILFRLGNTSSKTIGIQRLPQYRDSPG